MRITLYKTLLDKTERMPCLVKETATNYGGETLNNAENVVQMLRLVFHHDLETEEVVYLICLDTKHKPLGVFQLSRGTINLSCMNPREIYMKALLCNAAAIIIAHNHPSGDPTPSNDDVNTTKRIKEAGCLLGIKLLDSLVVASELYYSFAERSEL